jgi:O-antigen/teichoic acid export membrane protein
MFDTKKLIGDGLASVMSLAVLAASGVFLNSLIAKLYGAAGLGLFNTVFSIYILGSQVATLGVQFSVLRHIAEHGARSAESARIITSAAGLVALGAAAASGLVYLLFGVAGAGVYGPDLGPALLTALPGLWFFALNKLWLNALNGAQENKIFAALTAARHLLLAASLAVLAALGASAWELPAIFTVTEFLLFLLALRQVRRVFAGLRAGWSPDWAARHWTFGLRSLPGGLATELNTRVDVLVLGLFVSESQVGLYSFAALLVEGLLQLPAAARRLVDPVLTRLHVAGDRAGMQALLTRGRNWGCAVMALVCAASAAIYPFLARLLADQAIAAATWPIFDALLLGAFAFGSYAPLGGIFSQSGYPGRQSQVNLVILGLNLAFNLVFAPLGGPLGAAVATTLSFALGAQYFRVLVRRQLAFRL